MGRRSCHPLGRRPCDPSPPPVGCGRRGCRQRADELMGFVIRGIRSVRNRMPCWGGTGAGRYRAPRRKETLMGIGDLTSKAGEALGSDKAEAVTDQALDKAADAAKKATGGKFDSQVEAARDAADSKLGNA